MAARLISMLTADDGLKVKVYQDKALPVEVGQWAVITRCCLGETRWDGHSREAAFAEARRIVDAQNAPWAAA